MHSEKVKVAFWSVIAAVLLTILKLIVGILTRSLSIISEALHSGLDMLAAFVTLFAVKVSDKPADEEHTFGHGKIENFSALFEAILLLITCIWIVKEAVERLISQNYQAEVNIYSFAVMILSIVVNITRYFSLNNAAKKYNSQALKADALHFISDVYSSLVVIVGLIFTSIGFGFADPIAALGVSVLVLIATFRLGKDTIEVLLDTAPKGIIQDIKNKVMTLEGVISCDKVRVRASGPYLFIDISIGLNKYENHRDIHRIVYNIKQELSASYANSDISVYTFPIDVQSVNLDEIIFFDVKKICYEIKGIKNSHNIRILNIGDKKHISLHLETDNNIKLQEAHELVHKVKEEIMSKIDNVCDVSISLQHPQNLYSDVEDITDNNNITQQIMNTVNQIIDNASCHNIKVYKEGEKYIVFLHCHLAVSTTLQEAQKIFSNISTKLKHDIPLINDVHIHFEPNE